MLIETNDLIYEGIATLFGVPVILAAVASETNDLIYEGIATLCCALHNNVFRF